MTPPHLLHVFPTFALGGAQMRFASLANHFGARLRHTVIALDGETSARERIGPGVDLVFHDAVPRKRDTLRSVRHARTVLRKLRPDTLLTYNWGAIEWAMANRLPMLRQAHVEDGFGPEEQSRQIPRRVWTRRLALRGRTVVLPSQTLVSIATVVWHLDTRRLRFIPNGVDLGRFSPGPAHIGPCTIGTVAALRAEKNVGRLVRAFAALPVPDARLVIVGDGPERAKLEALASELGVAGRTRFTGRLADPAPMYREFDVFALSSDTEQQPLSLLEAMATGCAVVATGVGDVRAMLSEPNRAFVSRIDDGDFAAALSAVAEDRTRQTVLGQANRQQAQDHYDQQGMFMAWAAVFGL